MPVRLRAGRASSRSAPSVTERPFLAPCGDRLEHHTMSDDGASTRTTNSAEQPNDRTDRDPADRHRQALPGRRRQRRRQPHGPRGQRPRHRRRERRRQVHADEDALRRAPARRGHDHGQRHGTRCFSSPKDAIAAGIGMVLQAFMLAANLTVLENIVLGQEPGTALSLDIGQARSRILELGKQYGARGRPRRPDLRPRRRRRAARRDPQGALPRREDPDPRRAHGRARPPGGRRAVRHRCANSPTQGATIIFISHKLDEVLEHADAITVIRQGKTVGEIADPERRHLASSSRS